MRGARPLINAPKSRSFGVVLYELLTGRRPFHGNDLTEMLASVIKDQPDLDCIRVRVQPLLVRCLEKDPRKRLCDIGDAWIIIGGALPAESMNIKREKTATPNVGPDLALSILQPHRTKS